MKVKKSKLLKTICFSSLAMLMATTGVFAFAPLGISSAQEQPTTTTGLGLDPKNDPVVYTTESGLEIRMSNATKYSGTTTVTTNRGYSYTQDLTSFYYFTMGTFSGTIYTAAGGSRTASYSVSNAPINWIILGLGPNTAYFLDEVSENLFSTWKTNNSGYANSNDASGSYFFSNFYETDSPAGQLIDSTVSAKTYIMDKVAASIPQDPADEIPEGCMLVISEKLLGNMYFNSSGAINAKLWTQYSLSYIIYGNGLYGNRYRYHGNKDTTSNGDQTWTIANNSGGSLYNYINNLFSKNNLTGAIVSNSLGFSDIEADMIVPQQLYTYYSNGGSYHYQETPETDGGLYYSMFPLACRAANNSIKQNFCIEDYLPNATQRVATLINSNQVTIWPLRSGSSAYPSYAFIVEESGTCKGDAASSSNGVRPAMVMRLQ